MDTNLRPIPSNPSEDPETQSYGVERKKLQSGDNTFRKSMNRRGQHQHQGQGKGAESIAEGNSPPPSLFDLSGSGKPQPSLPPHRPASGGSNLQQGFTPSNPSPPSQPSTPTPHQPSGGGSTPQQGIAPSNPSPPPKPNRPPHQPSGGSSDSQQGFSPSNPPPLPDHSKTSTPTSSAQQQTAETRNQPTQYNVNQDYDEQLTTAIASSESQDIQDKTLQNSFSPADNDLIKHKKLSKQQIAQSLEAIQSYLASTGQSDKLKHSPGLEKFLLEGEIIPGEASAIIEKKGMLNPPVEDLLADELTMQNEDLTFNPPKEIPGFKLENPISNQTTQASVEITSEMEISNKKGGSKSTSIGSESKNIAPEGMINTQFSNFQTEVSPDTQRPLDTAAVRDLAAQIIDQIQIMTKGDETKTTITLSHPPILKGATITLTTSENANKEFNISFANLSNEGKLFLDNQLQQNSLTAALENKGITVHILTTSTQPEQLFQPTEKQAQRDGQEERQGQQQQREQESGNEQEKQKQRQQQRRSRDRREQEEDK